MRFGQAAAASALLGLAAVGSPARADTPKASVEGVTNDDLRKRIERSIGVVEHPADSRFQARQRANEAAEDAVAALRSEGYYAYEVEPELTDSDPPKPVVRIDPGPRFRLADPRVTWVAPPPDPESADAAVAAIKLRPGEPGRAADVIAGEGRVISALNQNGYADAAAEPREVIVDHAAETVQPTFRISAGELVHLDGVRVETAGRTNPAWVVALAPWKSGAVYDPDDVAELERRLLDTSVYTSVTVALAPESDADGLRPVVVSLADRPRRVLEAGVGWSTAEGFGLDTQWTWYNRLARADTLTAEVRLAELESRIGGALSLPHWRKPGRTLRLAGGLFYEDTEAYVRSGVGAEAALTHRLGKTSFITYGVKVEASHNEEPEFDPATGLSPTVERDLVTLRAIGGLALDRSDNPLNPTRGWRINGRLEPTQVLGDEELTYGRVDAQGTYYVPFNQGRTVVAGRLRLGSLVGGTLPEMPTAERYFAGGGGSVRGYAYQGVGPRFPDNTPSGGLSLAEGSLELRQRIFENWGYVLFSDVGAVGLEPSPSFDGAKFSLGVGARYFLPFGPIRADVAVPVNPEEGDPSFQIYISIGQAF
ncbi:autotransporter assembly complex family protein [Caulobacter sp. 17J65-9]|uniref:autotransporter assembly complex protein TamA n=1 Tax=Caulobacter sp. 17J65-9 TaxID=2709382 RepID=UPI0013C7005A|nr:autotransporter assembly complex family protein [Caulobacter sp. 17J65-9]NEX91984.1 outer membrane protein assembly factor [Caulobacter sp. 17J65-9]